MPEEWEFEWLENEERGSGAEDVFEGVKAGCWTEGFEEEGRAWMEEGS